jgi:hypothetical protein
MKEGNISCESYYNIRPDLEKEKTERSQQWRGNQKKNYDIL